MNYIKLFEDFNHEDAHNINRRNNLLLINKSKDIEVEAYGEKIKLITEIRLINNGTIEIPIMSYYQKHKSGIDIISLSYYKVDRGYILDLYKSSRYKIDNNNIDKIITMLNNAIPYLGNPDFESLESEIFSFFRNSDIHKKKLML